MDTIIKIRFPTMLSIPSKIILPKREVTLSLAKPALFNNSGPYYTMMLIPADYVKMCNIIPIIRFL